MASVLHGYTPAATSRLKTRFWQFVHEDGRDHNLPADKCWEWRGGVFLDGGPAYGTKHRVYPARYVAYALEVEDFDSDTFHILATCCNPKCVNPQHMRLAIRRAENNAPRDMKVAAVAAVSHAVECGKLPRVTTQVCVACGRRPAQYHHYLGYEPKHFLDVQPMCIRCHRRSEWTVIRESAPVYYA